MEPAISLGLTIAFAAAATYAVRGFGRRYGYVVQPRADRWHRTPTVSVGGTAIVLSLFAALASFSSPLPQVLPIAAGATLLFGMGLVDDIVRLRPYTKLVFQVVAAAGVVWFGPVLAWTQLPVLDYLITVFWLVGMTNAVNLLDNMDGLAAGISAIAAIFLGITFALNGQSAEALVVFLLAAALIGFLLFNFHPASIFMGDCGSMFLGFMLGGMALLSDYGRTRNLLGVLLTPVLILLIPIFDTCFVTITRKLAGRPVSTGGRDHTSHRLVALGIPEPRAVCLLYAIAAVSGALTVLLRFMAPGTTLVVIPLFAIAVIVLGFHLGQMKLYDGTTEPPPGLLKLMVDFGYKRRIFEVLLDAALIPLVYYAAYLIRWDGVLPPSQFAIFAHTVPALLGIQLSIFLFSGLYRGLWRYAGVGDLVNIARSVTLAAAASALAVFVMYDFQGPSRGVFVLNGVLLFMAAAGTRGSFRVVRHLLLRLRPHDPQATPLLIFGNGDESEFIIREMQDGVLRGYSPAAFVDDDNRNSGKVLRGVRILNPDEVRALAEEEGIREVLVAPSKASSPALACLKACGLTLRQMRIVID